MMDHHLLLCRFDINLGPLDPGTGKQSNLYFDLNHESLIGFFSSTLPGAFAEPVGERPIPLWVFDTHAKPDPGPQQVVSRN